MDLVPEVVNRLGEAVEMNEDKAVVIMPVQDQTLAGLGERCSSILSALKKRVSQETGVKLIDEDRFDRWMEERGPKSGEYWILANGESDKVSFDPAPDVILVPVCITSQEKESVLYRLELKNLELRGSKYTKAVAQVRRKAEHEQPSDRGLLVAAGIDVVTAANNHGGDYGPESVADTATWCETAGLVCVGIGNNAAAAEEPRLIRIGPLRVGLAGMDTTKPCFSAGENRPGTSYAAEHELLKSFTERVKRLGRWAEGRCDLLVLTIHWGKNWGRNTPPVHQAMARIAFEHGVDLILDLSSWWRVAGPVNRNVMPAFHISPEGDTPRRGTPWYTRHDAADWTVPLARVEPGTVIEDRYAARLAGLPSGPCKVYAVVIDTTRPEGNRVLAEPYLLGEVEIQSTEEKAKAN